MPPKNTRTVKEKKLAVKGLIVEKPFVEEEDLKSRKKIKIVDLFAGIGGLPLRDRSIGRTSKHGCEASLSL